MLMVRGFCDLNIRMDGDNTRDVNNTCEELFGLGYRTVAINSVFDGTIFDPKKKKKKGETQEPQTDLIPAPANEDIIKHFSGRLEIFQRLTVSISSQLQAHKLNQSDNAKKYNLLAVIPTTQIAFQHACSVMDVDLISFDPENMGLFKCNRKMYNVAVERGLSFEIMYTPAVRDSTARKNIIQLAHVYHSYGKSKHVVVSSGAIKPFHVRGPYDVINLGLLFGLSEEQSKGAITAACRFVLLRAAGRRLGKTVVIVNKNSDVNIDDDSDEMEQDVEQPVLKKKRRECTGDSDF